MKKQFLALALVAGMTSATVACGKTDSTVSAETTSAVTNAQNINETTATNEETLQATDVSAFPTTQDFFNTYNEYVKELNTTLDKPLSVMMPETVNADNQYTLGDNIHLAITETNGKISELKLTLDVPEVNMDDLIAQKGDVYNFAQTQANIIFISQRPFIDPSEADMFKESLLGLEGDSSLVLNDIGYSVHMDSPVYEFIMQDPATTIVSTSNEASESATDTSSTTTESSESSVSTTVAE